MSVPLLYYKINKNLTKFHYLPILAVINYDFEVVILIKWINGQAWSKYKQRLTSNFFKGKKIAIKFSGLFLDTQG